VTACLAAPVAWGLAPLPTGPDTAARRELAEHVAALCLALHGRTVGDCRRCAELLSGAHEHRYESRGQDDVGRWVCICGDTLEKSLARRSYVAWHAEGVA
jgi:hypothetical protein